MIKIITHITIMMTLLSLPLRANDAQINLLGWSAEGKFAFSITHPNPFDGYDASYYLVDLVDDLILVQFDAMHQDKSTATTQLKSRWQAIFQKELTASKLKPAGNNPLPTTFSSAGKSYTLILDQATLLLKEGSKQKVIASNLGSNTQLIASYLSPHESRIAIIIKENHQIKIFGSNLLLSFN